MSTHPLSIVELDEEGGSVMSLYSKGHHERDAFVAAVERYMAGSTFMLPVVSTFRQGYARIIPQGDFRWFHECPEPACGAFPITIIDCQD